ncbi:MAG: phosphatidylserine decarboxylase [Acetatifactor sp.]|nr:phosphatidylserine decarboxylase [Acetatifactor sp.]
MDTPVRPAKDSAILNFLYCSAAGRLALRFFSSRTLSRSVGSFLDSPLSKGLIKPFIERYGISLEDCETKEFRCFNDCFCRKMRKERRPIDRTPEALIAPCDGLLSAYQIKRNLIIPVKQSRFSLRSLLAGDEICREFEGGICLVFRLCVDHYHRYCYVDRGMKGENRFIEGRLHTVRPIALETFPVFVENCREYTVIDTENFGRIVQMEVGAMLVGKILNYHGMQEVRRGQEKGRFLYGGSTVIVLLKKGVAKLPSGLFKATAAGLEVPVKLGEKIGTRVIDE